MPDWFAEHAPPPAGDWFAANAPPIFTSTNAKDAAGDAEVDPNTLGTFARHVGQQVDPRTMIRGLNSMIPVPKVAGGGGLDAPGNVFKFVQHSVFPTEILNKTIEAFHQGDYVTASRHFLNYLLPVVGPMLEHPTDEVMSGHYAAGLGDFTGLGAALFGPEVFAKMLSGARLPALAKPNAAVDFGRARGVPIDAATASDNLAVRGTQALADRSLGGSIVATPARAAQAQAMTRVGEELAADVHPTAVMPEQAGQSVRQALTAKIDAHTSTANAAYDRLRKMEANPMHGEYVPVDVTPAAKARMQATLGEIPTAEDIQGLRRIREEMRALPFQDGKLVETLAPDGSVNSTYTPRQAGARVFHDITQASGSNMTRAEVEASLDRAIETGNFTPVSKAALDVARKRVNEPYSVSRPLLNEDAGAKTQGMLMPVDLRAAKAQLKPIYEQLMREKDIAPMMGARGRALVALDRLMRAPDHAPVSIVDAALGDLKALDRATTGPGQGLVKQAVKQVDAAVQTTVAKAGPEAMRALREGRDATKAKYATADVLDALHEEPVKAMNSLTAPKDAAIQKLRTVIQHVPKQADVIARAYLEDLLAKPNRVAEWGKLGAQTKAILFPKAGQAEALDQFFALTKRISDTNVNPSGSGYMAALGAQGAMLWYDPLHAVPMQISAAALAKLLHSPAAVKALTRGASLSLKTPTVVRAAATAKLLRAAQEAGVTVPQSADQGPRR